jgi:hypothetical protein
MKKLYLIGSLKNPEVPLLGNQIRALGFDVFDEWFGAGERADECWQAYEETRGRHYRVALYGRSAVNIYQFDLRNLNDSDLGVLLLPAGKSGHLELGYLIGQGKPGFVLFPEEPTHWDVMYQFAREVFFHPDDLIQTLKEFL